MEPSRAESLHFTFKKIRGSCGNIERFSLRSLPLKFNLGFALFLCFGKWCLMTEFVYWIDCLLFNNFQLNVYFLLWKPIKYPKSVFKHYFWGRLKTPFKHHTDLTVESFFRFGLFFGWRRFFKTLSLRSPPRRVVGEGEFSWVFSFEGRDCTEALG